MRRSRPGLGQIWPSGPISSWFGGPETTTFGPIWSNFSQVLPAIDQVWVDFDQSCPDFEKSRPILARHYATFDPISAPPPPTLARKRPNMDSARATSVWSTADGSNHIPRPAPLDWFMFWRTARSPENSARRIRTRVRRSPTETACASAQSWHRRRGPVGAGAHGPHRHGERHRRLSTMRTPPCATSGVTTDLMDPIRHGALTGTIVDCAVGAAIGTVETQMQVRRATGRCAPHFECVPGQDVDDRGPGGR